ncbi:protein unc-93 homolog A-like isoform X1 [Haliotis rubra]|uniref:protein unc-93 homolog A-like isoform X1 n=1 Tax=Haliotis rubra TaxID=36100 RepID=UPI001EE50852|nr:protein unc-93 homolog A-like isoform X1 [Haliotis rubra]
MVAGKTCDGQGLTSQTVTVATDNGRLAPDTDVSNQRSSRVEMPDIDRSDDCSDACNKSQDDNQHSNMAASSNGPAHTPDHKKQDNVHADPFSNTDYTDSVGSADSTKFLLPLKDNDSIVHDCAQSSLDISVSPKISINDVVIDCYENRNYTDSVTSHFSASQPLLNTTDNIRNFVKEVETPVLGLIDHPGFMSSQRDLSSTSNITFACQKALKYLQDERVASSLLLPGSAKDVSKLPPEDGNGPYDVDHNIVPSGRHTRNLIALSVSITMAFIASGTLRNLQTSLNHEGGVGVISLAMTFMGFMIGSVFSPFLVQNFHPYRALLVSMLPYLLYIAANFYPAMWLMTPVSLLWGVSFALMWNAMSTYITFLAKGYSEKKKQDYEIVLSRFFGIFYLVWQLYMIFGNLIASLVLTYANPTGATASSVTSNYSVINQTLTNQSTYSFPNESVILNSSSPPSHLLCGANYCHHYTISSTGSTDNSFAKYVLYGVNSGVMLLAVLIAFFLLEPLNSRLFSATISCNVVKTQIVSLGRFALNRKFLLLCPLLLFSQMQAAFASGEIAKAFVTCPIGVHMVGYTLICMGVSGSLSAYLSGWLCRYVGRTVMIGSAVAVDLGLLTLMAIWTPTPDSLVVIFVLIGLWGVSDGIWMAQSNSLMGVLFPDQFEEAFTGMRVMQGLGPTIAFAYAQFFCMATKIYIMAGICVLALVGYLITDHIVKKERKVQTLAIGEKST